MTIIAPSHDARKLPRQARSRALVDAILDAGARILADGGRERLTTNAVALKAGVSIGSLYQYFPNREAIIAAVAARHDHRIHHHVVGGDMSAETTLEAAIARVAGRLFAAHRLDPALHAALDGDVAHRHGGTGHQQRHQGGTKAAMIACLRALPDGARREIRRRDPDLAMLTVAEIVHAMAHAAIAVPRDGREPADLEREAITAAIAYLRAPD